jgi:HlyD family secretion protein
VSILTSAITSEAGSSTASGAPILLATSDSAKPVDAPAPAESDTAKTTETPATTGDSVAAAILARSRGGKLTSAATAESAAANAKTAATAPTAKSSLTAATTVTTKTATGTTGTATPSDALNLQKKDPFSPRKPDSRPPPVPTRDNDDDEGGPDITPNIADFVDDEENSGKTKWGTVLLILLLILILAAGAFFAWKHFGVNAAGTPSKGSYRTERVQNGPLSQVIKTTGTINPQNQVTVSSELSNIGVQAVYVESNARVTKDQKLAQLDTEKLNQAVAATQAALRSAEANVRATEATRKKTKADHERNEDLFKKSNGLTPSKQEIDASKAAADRAEAEYHAAVKAVEKANAQYEINNTDLKKATIKSPMDGIVLKRSIEPGQTVVSRLTPPELFVIADDLKRMKLVVGIAEADISRVVMGQNAKFTVPAQPTRKYEAKVTKIENNPVTKNNLVTYNVELEVSNNDETLKAGMSAETEIQAGKLENALYVSSAALRFAPETHLKTETKKEEKSLLENLAPRPPPRRVADRTQKNAPAAPANGKGRIYVLENKKIRPVEVSIGLTTEQYTQIFSNEISANMEIVVGYN